MKVYCTRPNCQNPVNFFNSSTWADLQSKRQQFCSACTMPLMIGGQYLPVEQLGVGANGVTFLAIDLYTKNRRQCVIKQFCPNPKLVSSQIAEIKDQFRQETQALEALCGHSRIPSLYCYLDLSVPAFLTSQPNQSKQLNHLFYLVWEYVEGQVLAQELSQSHRFSEAEVIAALRSLLPLLLFIHEHQVIHQAIEPAHIIRDPKGQLSLINFSGIKQAIAKTSLPNSKGPDVFSFAAPEQKARRNLRPASDLYSLGVTALCLLGGYESLKEMYEPHTERWNWQSRIQVSDRLGGVLNRLLEPKLERRFQSAAEVLVALPQEVFATQSVNNSRPDSTKVEVLDLPQGIASVGTLPNEPRIADREIRSVENLDISSFESISSSVLDDLQSNPTLESEPSSNPKSRSGFEGKTRSKVKDEPTPEREEHILFKLACQAAILGSGGWILAIALLSFLGTVLTSGFWILILGGLIFSVFAKTQSLFEKIRFLMIALVSVGAVFFLFPQFLSVGNLFQQLPQTLLLAMIAGLIAFVLVMSFQFLEKLISESK